MRTLSSETSFVEMGEEKFFKWFPKFGTKSYQNYLNCMEILWVNKHSLRRMYISHRSWFTEKNVFFWLQKLLLKWTSNFFNGKIFHLENFFLINLLSLVNVLLWRAMSTQLIKLFWSGYPFQTMLGLKSWKSWFPVPITTCFYCLSRQDPGPVRCRCCGGVRAQHPLQRPPALPRGRGHDSSGQDCVWEGDYLEWGHRWHHQHPPLSATTESSSASLTAGTPLWPPAMNDERSSLVYTCGEAGLNDVDGQVITGGWPRDTCRWLGRPTETQPLVSRCGDGSVTRTRKTFFIDNNFIFCEFLSWTLSRQ